MKSNVLALLFASILVCTSLEAQQQKEDLAVVSGWMQFSDAPNALYHHLASQAFTFLDERQARIAKLTTANEWRARSEEIRSTLHRIVGPFPAKTPLNAKVTGVVHKEGYRFEKILFESVQGFYVTGVLFVPDDLKGKAPAILYVCGHSATGFRHEPYLVQILNLVKKGFVVFAIDPVGQGERIQYWDPGTQSSWIGDAVLEHSYPGAQCFMTGYSPARYLIWDGIRAIDYLAGRPEVDSNRLGLTGRSGGGTQSAYIAALDLRIKAVAPENYLTTFQRLIQTRGVQDAEQNFMGGIQNGIDMPDLLVARAPLATLMVTTTRDIFSIQGAREAYEEALPAFRALGNPNALIMVEDDAGHASRRKNREAIYAFFRQALNLPGPVGDEEVAIMPKEELNVTPTGQLATSFKGETLFSLNAVEARRRLAAMAKSSPESRRKEILESARTLSGYRAPGESAEVVFNGRWQRDGYSVEMFFTQGEGDYPVPFLVFVPERAGKHSAIIYLHPEGKAADSAPGGVIEQLIKQGYVVAAPDLVGIGEMGPGRFRGDSYNFKVGKAPYNLWFAAIQIGRSLTGIRAADVTRVIRALKRRKDVDTSELAVVSVGELSPVLLHAAVFDPCIKRVAMFDSLVSWTSIVLNRDYAPRFIPHAVPGSLGHYDLPDLAALLAPRKLLMAGIVDQLGNPAEQAMIDQALAPVRAAYSASSASLDVRPGVAHAKLVEVLADWLQ